VYGHVNQEMEITDDFQFLFLWQEISVALVRIQVKSAWQRKLNGKGPSIKLSKNPLTAEVVRNVQELLEWDRNDTEVKQSIEEFENFNWETFGTFTGRF